MIYLRFALSALAVAVGGILVAQFGDVIALRTGLGRFLFGTILLAAGTSLPELIAALNAVAIGLPDLAAGTLIGAVLTDMFFLGLLDFSTRRTRPLHQVAITHSLTASLGVLMLGVAAFFILVPLGWEIGTVDLEGLVLVALFVGGVRVIQLRARAGAADRRAEAEVAPRFSLPAAIAGFVGATALLVVASPVLVGAAEAIAVQTGLGTGLVGVILLGLITDVPDLLSAITAVRLGAFDLAVGNFFGTSVFDTFALGLVSLFFPGSLFATISSGFVAVALLAIILICLALLGTLANLEWRPLHIEWDAALIIAVYLAGVYLLYRQGLLLVQR